MASNDMKYGKLEEVSRERHMKNIVQSIYQNTSI